MQADLSLLSFTLLFSYACNGWPFTHMHHVGHRGDRFPAYRVDHHAHTHISYTGKIDCKHLGWGNYAGIIFNIMQGFITPAFCKQIVRET